MVERDPTAGTLWRLGCLHRRSDCTELPIRQRQEKKKNKKPPDEPQPKHATDPQTHTADSHSSSWTHHAPLINVLPDRVSLIMSFWIFFLCELLCCKRAEIVYVCLFCSLKQLPSLHPLASIWKVQQIIRFSKKLKESSC